MKIIIISVGIGGLTTALSLHNAGLEVKIFESVKTILTFGRGN